MNDWQEEDLSPQQMLEDALEDGAGSHPGDRIRVPAAKRSIALALLSVPAFCLPFVGDLVAPLTCVASISHAVFAIRLIRREPDTYSGLRQAWTGLGLGVVSLILVLLLFVLKFAPLFTG